MLLGSMPNRLRRIFLFAFAATSILIGLCFATRLKDRIAPTAHAAAFTVNTADDHDDGVCNAADCTLREAINAVNAGAGGDTISFNIPGAGVHTINVGASGGFSIIKAVTIDGTTQPGFAGVPLIEINGVGAGAIVVGFNIQAQNVTVKSLIINRFTNYGFNFDSFGNDSVQGCYIGTNAAGTAASPNGAGGIRINVGGITIGGTTAAARNVISGNTGNGIDIISGFATIQGNYIGTNAAGTASLGNLTGVNITGGAATIGGTAAGAGNIISGNGNVGISIQSSLGGTQIQGNFIGADVTGTSSLPNSNAGINISNSPNNTIGGNTSAARNVVSGNRVDGIEITGNTATGNTVQGNFIGTNAAGTAALANGGGGISVTEGPNNTIGGSTAGARNVISGNASSGLAFSGSSTPGNQVQGNFIGLNAAGTAPIANRIGVLFELGASNNTVGGTTSGAGNVISGNRFQGIWLTQSPASNLIQGNFIGTNPAGTGSLANGADGVLIDSGSNNTVGGTNTGARNIISGNGGGGVDVTGGSGTTIQGNFIGTNAAGDTKVPNVAAGISLQSANNTIGGTSAGARNVISGNIHGVEITGSTATGNQVQGNYIGTNAAGSSPLGNIGVGVYINYASNNTIGGTTAAARNVIANTNGDGISIFAAGGTGTNNLVQGNFIGTDVTGMVNLGNSTSGVQIYGAAGNVIGGTAAGAGNLISGNSDAGILMRVNATGNQVQGNLIGTNAAGTAAMGNGRAGVRIEDSSNNTIGGTSATARNVISGNFSSELLITGSGATGNQVQGNFIGVNPAGTAVMSNGSYGVYIDRATSNTIGGTTAAARNVISGHSITNVAILTAGTTGNQIIGNFIGTQADGVSQLSSNPGAGVYIFSAAANNFIGGTAAGSGNVIAFNGQGGVRIDGNAGNGNAILGNSIFSNTGLGIDLNLDGVTANDNCDPDTGPNNLQNFPVITSATANATTTTVQGTINSNANTTFRIEFFSNASCDASGNGQGQTFLGFTNVTTDSSCNGNFVFTVPNGSINGTIITATATDPNGNTSEFSACATDVGISGTLQFSASNFNVTEGCATANITVTRTGSTAGTVTVDFATSDGTALQRTDYTLTSGTLTFGDGVSSQNFPVLVCKDAYVEGNETVVLSLSNATGGAAIGSPNPSTLTILDDTSVPTNTQPIDDASTFVCQHYHDFLSREPDPGGLAYWTGQITQCGTDQTCIRNKRVDVSNAFFFELEYQQTAAYVFRLYRAAYGNNQPFPNPDATNPAVPIAQQAEAKKLPSYAVFSKDRARLIGSANLAQDQLALANVFVSRPEFLNRYPASTLDVFVDAVLATINSADGVNLSAQRSALIALGSRGAVMFRLANDDGSGTNGGINNRAFIDAEYNRSFVAAEYFGYLRRDADIGGFLFWLGQVNRCPVRDGGAQHAMVCSFITSAEYQNRFSAAVTHNNGECPQGTVCSSP